MSRAATKIRPQGRRLANPCIPAIVAVGSSIACGSAAAIELGDLKVHSTLGQPLRASIAYALSGDERISDSCVSMRSGPSMSGLPSLGAARLSVGDGVFVLLGETPVREPMVSAHVIVNCPYAPNLSREYLVFVDPHREVQQAAAAPRRVETGAAQSPAPTPVALKPAAAVAEPVQASPPLARPAPIVRELDAAARYQVRAGDTLSGIAARIRNRPVGLWPAVEAIFQANPEAFVSGDPNQLKAGAWLSIPAFNGDAASVQLVPAEAGDATITVDAALAAALPVKAAAPALESTVVPVETSVAIESASTAAAVPAAAAQQPAEIATGGIVLDDLPGNEALAVPAEQARIILDTTLPGPESSSQSPNATTAVVVANERPEISQSSSPAWLVWLAAAALAIALALTLFRRRLGFESDAHPTPPLAGDHPMRRFTDSQTFAANDALAGNDADDVAPPAAAVTALHARVVTTADIADSASDMTPADNALTAQAQLAAATELDIDLSQLPEPADDGDTFEVPFDETGLHSTLALEELDDDYDMSVIVDATKMPQPEDATAYDFKALEVVADDESVLTQTLPRDPDQDYQVLEQDYEDELTATQALNLEIAQAAAELTAKLEIRQARGAAKSSDDTTAVQLATVTELDLTAEMPVQENAAEYDDNDTVEMPVESGKAR